MRATEDTLSSETTPFAGVPGLRAAYFRFLYRVAMRLKAYNDTRRVLDGVFEKRQQFRARWDQEHASRKADRVMSLVISVIIGLMVVTTACLLFSENKQSGVEQRDGHGNRPSDLY